MKNFTTLLVKGFLFDFSSRMFKNIKKIIFTVTLRQYKPKPKQCEICRITTTTIRTLSRELSH